MTADFKGAPGIVRLAAGLISQVATVACLATPGAGQTAPVFQLQPGIAVADFVSVPEGTESTSAFALRFATRIPLSRLLNPVMGAVLLPYGSTGITNRDTDAPTVFAGNIFRVVGAAQTGGWWSVEIPLLIYHAPGAGPSGSIREYGRDVVVVPTAYFHLGSRGLGELGAFWSRLDAFLQLEQNLTPGRDPTSRKRDRFNPVATFGASFSFGPALRD